MKTSEEIKKALKLCQNGSCKFCPYDDDESCGRSKNGDALAYIQQLEDGIDHATQIVRSSAEIIKKNMERLESRLAQVERERDAAVYDLAILKLCHTCVEDATTSDYGSARCHACVNKSNWEWRGVCEENTKEET